MNSRELGLNAFNLISRAKFITRLGKTELLAIISFIIQLDSWTIKILFIEIFIAKIFFVFAKIVATISFNLHLKFINLAKCNAICFVEAFYDMLNT